MKKVLFFVSIAVLSVSCKDSGTTRVSATGSIYECLVVMPSSPLTQGELNLVRETEEARPTGSAYDEPVQNTYDLVRLTLEAPMPCLPQIEPYFKLTQVPAGAFDNILKPTRNILLVDIDPTRFTQVKAKTSFDVWSHPQAVYRIQAPDQAAFVDFWLHNGEAVREWFVRQELNRQLSFYRYSTNQDGRQALHEDLNCDLWVPEDFMLIDRLTLAGGTKVVWFCNNKGPMRKDLVVYSYPYTDANAFTLAKLNKTRDEVLGQFISGSVAGSYMGTEYKVFPPQLSYSKPLSIMDYVHSGHTTIYEVRGLWKLYNGEAMGGPYVSLTRLDEEGQRVVTAETFLFAPGQKKRTALHQSEAILYSLSFYGQ